MASVVTDYHAAHFTSDGAREMVWSVVSRHLARYLPPGSRVLEIGAGRCEWINQVQAEQRVAVDIWPEFSRYAGHGVQTIVLDASTALRSLGDASFDVVLASNVLEHFAPDAAAAVVGDIAELLRPGGRIILVQPNFRYAWRHYFDDYTHRSVFTHVSLPALLRSRGFEVEDVQPRFLPYSMIGSRVPIRPWLVAAYLRSPVRPMAGQMLVVARRR